MKNIYRTLMAFAAAFLLVPVVNAQTTPPYQLDETSGYAYTKYLKSDTPNANGEYTIRIETFATGDVNNVPSDIVFVLDMSGSMRYDYIVSKPSTVPTSLSTTSTLGKQLIKEEGTNGGKVWYAQNRAFYAKFNPYVDTEQTTHRWVPNTCLLASAANNTWQEGGTVRYYLLNGTYYLVKQGTLNGKYCLYFDVGSTRHYLTESGQTTNSNNAKTTTNRNPITPSDAQTVHKGNLYRFKTRLEILQDAAVSFVEAMSANSAKLVAQGKDPNRLAIVQFSGCSNPRGSLQTSDPGSVTINNTTYPDHTFVKMVFTNLTSANATSIENSIREMLIASETPVHAGMRQARLLLDADNTNHNKYVVVFTDGEPRKKVGNADDIESFYSIVSKAMTDANLIRRKTGINAEIFTMGLDPTPTSKTFLQWLSSEKLDPVTVTSASGGTAATYSGSANPKASTAHYYQDNQSSNFNEIFDNIAAHIISNSQSVASVDLISASFTLPANVDPSRVDVYTAQCTGKSGNYLTFGSEVKAPNRGNVNVWVTTNGTTWTQKSLDIDNNISITTDATNDKVVVSGFDYATLWCGYDAAHSSYHGYKLIFEFPIVIKDGAMGGPDVPTNEEESGLYPIDSDGNIGTTPIILYPIPEVAIPIRLIVQKTGLAKGESASFTVERKLISGSGSWEYYTSFILTGNSGSVAPEVRLLNLDPLYYYRVKETGWSWAYELAGDEYISTQTLDPKVNPLVFSNTPKTDVPKHAEAKSVNTMKVTSTGEDGSTTTTVYD